MPTAKFEIKGNFLVISDAVIKNDIVRIGTNNVSFRRDRYDNFAFILDSGINDEETNRLGLFKALDFSNTYEAPIQWTVFAFADIVDSTGTPFVSADGLDDWLSDNLGIEKIIFIGDGYLSSVSTDSTLTGDGTVSDPLSVVPQQASIGNYAQTVQGPTINTIGEQSIIGSGVGSLSIPANGFVIGDSFHGKIGGLINATGGGGRSEIIINIRSNGTILATTGSFDLDNATNQGWEMELDFTIRSIGTTGIICTNGNFVYTKDNNRSVFGYIFQDNKTINTTAISTLDVTVEWRVLNTGDDIYSANFVLYKVF